MKIFIDMQGLQTPFSSKRGVGTYIDSIVRELHKAARGHELHYVFNAEFPEEYFSCLGQLSGIIERGNSHVFTQRIIRDYYSADETQMVVAESFFSAFVESFDPDVLFSPNLQEGLHDRAVTPFAARSGSFAQVATLHDMVPMYLESEYLSDPGTNRWYRRKIADAARCDRIVTVSTASKRDIERFLGVEPARVQAIPNGYDADKFNVNARPGERGSVSEFIRWTGDYILYFGGADRHKNVLRLVEAYASLPKDLRSRFPLVLGGRDMLSASDLLKEIGRRGLESDVRLPGFIPDALLPALMRQASLFVFPSTYEGFGLPPIEAMACGTPTIASSTSAVGEVVANPSGTFDPFDHIEIARLLKKGLEDESWRRSLREHGLKRAGDFSWHSAAEDLLQVFEEENDRRVTSGRLSFIARRLAESLPLNAPDVAAAAAATIAETAPEPRPRRIYLDASSVALYGGNSGIQRVVREIARYLPDAFAEDEAQVAVVYAPEGTTEFRILSSIQLDGSVAAAPGADELADFGPKDTLVFLDLHPGLAIRMEYEIQRMRTLGVRVYHVVYDILPMLMPEKFWPDLQQEFYRWLQCVSRSDGLLCISRTVAEQTSDYLSSFGEKRSDALPIGHFRLGSDFESVAGPAVLAEVRAELGDAPKADYTYLMVGTLEPRKAHEQTILAFEQAWAAGEPWRLVIAGKQGWKMDRLGQYVREHPEFGRRLFWFDKASDDFLRGLYGIADCVICASEGEGFGLPLIEAAHAEKPVIARDIPVFREVANDGAFYFADDSAPETILTAIRSWISAFSKGKHPRPSRMRPLSWQQAASEFASALAKAPPLTVKPAGALDLRNPVTTANGCLRTGGVYPKEGTFAWTAARASIEFDTVEDFERVNLELDCFSWRRMPFEILQNGEKVYSSEADRSSSLHRIVLRNLSRGTNRLEIRSAAAGSPGKGDNRALGIAIRDLRMFAHLPVKTRKWINARDLNVEWSGFSEVEFDWRWTVKERAAIEFYLAEDCPGAVISIFGRAARHSDATFLLNGEAVDRQDLPTEARTIVLPPARLRKGKNRLELQLSGVKPFSANDRRLLGLTVLELQISECSTASDEDCERTEARQLA